MPFATREQFEKTIGAEALTVLSDTDGSGVRDEDALEAALTKAEARVAGHVRSRFNPIPEFDPSSTALLAGFVIDIAAYEIARDHGRLTETIADRFKGALDALAMVSSGKIELALLTPPDAAGGAVADGDTLSEGGDVYVISRSKQWGGPGAL
jgi:phage gp36-like protein